MKKIIILLFLATFFAYGQSENPPGTIKLDDGFYIDQVPISNYMFAEYLTVKEFLKENGYDSFSNYSKTLTEDKFPIEILEKYDYPSIYLVNEDPKHRYLKRKEYYKDTIYIDHPVINISKEKAKDYCKWRTEMVKHLWLYHEKHIDKRQLANKINYRLPSKTELIYAKEEFKSRNELTEYIDEKVLNIQLDYQPKGYIILPIIEYTESDDFNNQGINKRKKFIGFRCVCEIEQ